MHLSMIELRGWRGAVGVWCNTASLPISTTCRHYCSIRFKSKHGAKRDSLVQLIYCFWASWKLEARRGVDEKRSALPHLGTAEPEKSPGTKRWMMRCTPNRMRSYLFCRDLHWCRSSAYAKYDAQIHSINSLVRGGTHADLSVSVGERAKMRIA